jgi:hypothetical protein
MIQVEAPARSVSCLVAGVGQCALTSQAPKGVSKLNPKAGQLSAKLAEERRVNKSPQQVPNARMMVSVMTTR